MSGPISEIGLPEGGAVPTMDRPAGADTVVRTRPAASGRARGRGAAAARGHVDAGQGSRRKRMCRDRPDQPRCGEGPSGFSAHVRAVPR
jgi:hypothetical protein